MAARGYKQGYIWGNSRWQKSIGVIRMDPELISVFNDLLGVERSKLNEQLQRDLGAAQAELSGNGTLRSSMALKVIAGAAGNAVPIFAQVALNLIIRA